MQDEKGAINKIYTAITKGMQSIMKENPDEKRASIAEFVIYNGLMYFKPDEIIEGIIAWVSFHRHINHDVFNNMVKRINEMAK